MGLDLKITIIIVLVMVILLFIGFKQENIKKEVKNGYE